jgi:hypothetical protein
MSRVPVHSQDLPPLAGNINDPGDSIISDLNAPACALVVKQGTLDTALFILAEAELDSVDVDVQTVSYVAVGHSLCLII